MPALSRRHLLQTAGGFALAAASPAWAGPAIVQDWSSDIAILRRAWETMHPGLYRYSTPDQISGRLDALAVEWSGPSAFRQRFAALTRVTASVRCGHTYPSPYNGGEAVRALIYPDRSLVPFRFVWIDGRMVVTHDDSAEQTLPRGTQIIAIDGLATSEILAQLLPMARADGASDAKRVSLMEVRGDDGYETFDIHLPLIMPIRDRAVFSLRDGATVQAELLTLAQRRANRTEAETVTEGGNPWSLKKDGDGIVRLTMPGWALYDSAFDWQTWLGGVMDDLTGDGARGLIVDLRGNEGGLDCGNIILSRLIQRDIPLSRNQRFVRYRQAPEDLHPYLDTWDRSFLDWGEQAIGPDARGFYRLTRYDDGDASTVIPALGRRYAGPVVVLCDASNSSATFVFAQSVKDLGLATLLGTTTGGNRRGINGGAFFFLRLPASGLEIDLPLIASFPGPDLPDAAIQPDIFVPATAADIAAGLDPQMAAASALILNA
ncbi:MAG: S41 family peptidase [Alphaproteobacteria bacterium]|nr:S41 family peptidase [Alphaproteobacteria bacterium]MBU2380333.1 S41 family peptidase [Alphaproteobacteria bacterium]